MKCYFVFNKESAYYNSDIFSGILDYVQKNPGNASLKQANNLILTFNQVHNMEHAKFLLKQIDAHVEEGMEAEE